MCRLSVVGPPYFFCRCPCCGLFWLPGRASFFISRSFSLVNLFVCRFSPRVVWFSYDLRQIRRIYCSEFIFSALISLFLTFYLSFMICKSCVSVAEMMFFLRISRDVVFLCLNLLCIYFILRNNSLSSLSFFVWSLYFIFAIALWEEEILYL